jgi:hypothetical protein
LKASPVLFVFIKGLPLWNKHIVYLVVTVLRQTMGSSFARYMYCQVFEGKKKAGGSRQF